MTEQELLSHASTKKVLFCGERIIDVYHYVHPLGKPTKDAIVAVQHERTEEFDGGVIAAAAHARDFAGQVDICYGGIEIRKCRYVESKHFRKLFEVYDVYGGHEAELPMLGDYDAVIVTDYGHGFVTPKFLESLRYCNYLAVNVQTNSGNYGFNLATKYGWCDYLCVDEPEARLATQNRLGPIEDSLLALASRAEQVVITLGKAGAIGYSVREGICRVPAFTDSVVDTIGAGDAFFAITALVAEHSGLGSLLRIGNAAGAIKSGIIGHSRSVTKNELTDLLEKLP